MIPRTACHSFAKTGLTREWQEETLSSHRCTTPRRASSPRRWLLLLLESNCLLSLLDLRCCPSIDITLSSLCFRTYRAWQNYIIRDHLFLQDLSTRVILMVLFSSLPFYITCTKQFHSPCESQRRDTLIANYFDERWWAFGLGNNQHRSWAGLIL